MADINMKKVAERNAGSLSGMVASLSLELSYTQVRNEELENENNALHMQVDDLTAELQALRAEGEEA